MSQNKICEICGKEIITPNYVVECVNGLFNNQIYFATCAFCELERLIDEYMEFKDDINNIEFHINQLNKINELYIELI